MQDGSLTHINFIAEFLLLWGGGVPLRGCLLLVLRCRCKCLRCGARTHRSHCPGRCGPQGPPLLSSGAARWRRPPASCPSPNTPGWSQKLQNKIWIFTVELHFKGLRGGVATQRKCGEWLACQPSQWTGPTGRLLLKFSPWFTARTLRLFILTKLLRGSCACLMPKSLARSKEMPYREKPALTPTTHCKPRSGQWSFKMSK